MSRGTPTTNDVRSEAARADATSAAASTDPPAATTSAAAHAQHEIPKLAVPVSTRRIATSTMPEAMRAALSVPLIAAAMWIDSTSVAPRSARRV